MRLGQRASSSPSHGRKRFRPSVVAVNAVNINKSVLIHVLN